MIPLINNDSIYIYTHTSHTYIYIHVTYIYTYIIHMCVNPWGKDLMEKNVFLTTWLVWMMWPASEVCTLLPSRQTFSLVVPWAVALWDCSKWQLMAGNWSKIGIWGFLLWFSCYGSLINSSFEESNHRIWLFFVPSVLCVFTVSSSMCVPWKPILGCAPSMVGTELALIWDRVTMESEGLLGLIRP